MLNTQRCLEMIDCYHQICAQVETYSSSHLCVAMSKTHRRVTSYQLWGARPRWCFLPLRYSQQMSSFYRKQWKMGQILYVEQNSYSRWWQLKYFAFSPLLGKDSHFDSYFSDGLVQPPTSILVSNFKPAGHLFASDMCRRQLDSLGAPKPKDGPEEMMMTSQKAFASGISCGGKSVSERGVPLGVPIDIAPQATASPIKRPELGGVGMTAFSKGKKLSYGFFNKKETPHPWNHPGPWGSLWHVGWWSWCQADDTTGGGSGSIGSRFQNDLIPDLSPS